jgi:elongation factor P--beta-lysine ligase
VPAAQDSGLSDCSGVALAPDYLLMALIGKARIDCVLTFMWAKI